MKVRFVACLVAGKVQNEGMETMILTQSMFSTVHHRPEQVQSLVGYGAHHRPDLAAGTFEQSHHHELVAVVAFEYIELTLGLRNDAPLRSVAVHAQHIVPQSIVQPACEQNREGLFSHTVLL